MHRNDIDGLRAVAVLPVLAFHFLIFPTILPGGFIGVDIFFVISGYLITSTIFRDINARRYSIVDFYNRRIRRIFPALFAVFAFCMVVAFLTSLPPEAAETGRSILSSIFFVSNYLFYSQSGYFDRGAETNPLLHTWSLSVEEQFYVIFPVIIFLMRGLDHRSRVRLLWSIALVSLLASVWMVSRNSSAAFYLVQYRAWELLVGSLLAVGAVPKIVHQKHAEMVATGGLALIIAGVFLISRDTPFPGLAALAPCLGAAAVIHSGEAHRTFVGRLLSVLPVRFIGLISYSLYLWHWPVIVFYRLLIASDPTRMERGILVFVCILAATLSWWFVERPFREKPYRLNARGTLAAGGLVMISTAAAALVLPSLTQSVFQYPGRAIQVWSFGKIDESHMRGGTCFATDVRTIIASGCLMVRPNTANVLLVGDSHAAHLWPGLQATYPQVNFLQATIAGCTPILDYKSNLGACTEMLDYIVQKFLPNVHLDGIILSGRWYSGDVLPALLKTADALRPYADRIVVFGPLVEYDRPLPRLIAKAIATNKSEAEVSDLHRSAQTRETDQAFSQAIGQTQYQYVSVYRALCTPTCEIWATREVPLMFDKDHLTCAGSIHLARKVGPQMFPKLPLGKGQNDTCPINGIAGRASEAPTESVPPPAR